MTKQRYDVRGMNINERMALVKKVIDRLIDENEENFRIDMLDGGLLLEDANACIESQRAEKADWRKKVLANMRRFLERDGKDGAPRR
jgi:hypothetical protein